eukprot:TRINITY_DN2553_c0_g1_i2.p1 TRINITY_DN2553_c0_g1~~TRINITY_DN2553_c0_g1_i2.p1  ORF type:complete len:140 (+),score=16.64 TRINITY_DN2553_c0_g1_i2:382-801(+)
MLEDIQRCKGTSIKRNWNIVNIGSIVSRMPYPLRTPYSASKWGLLGLNASLAKEVGPQSIRVNAILPGAIRGKRLDNVMKNRAEATGLTFEAVQKQLLENTALKRFVEKSEVADSVMMMAEATGITGQSLLVDNGALMI